MISPSNSGEYEVEEVSIVLSIFDKLFFITIYKLAQRV